MKTLSAWSGQARSDMPPAMPTLLPPFLERMDSHNRHVALAAFLSLLGACLAWAFAYALVIGLVLGAFTVAHGQEILAEEPVIEVSGWLYPGALLLALATLVWEAVDEWRTRFLPVSDRAVIGWHILGDILLLPARLTFGIGVQLSAIICLNRRAQIEAQELLRHIHHEKRCAAHSLGAWVSDQKRLRKLLGALQMAGWIELLRTEAGWIYIERSSEAAPLAAMFDAGDEDRDEERV